MIKAYIKSFFRKFLTVIIRNIIAKKDITTANIKNNAKPNRFLFSANSTIVSKITSNNNSQMKSTIRKHLLIKTLTDFNTL